MHHVHHSAIVASDLDRSLRFWGDGLGFAVLMDETFPGPWSELFDVDADRLRAVFLGDRDRSDTGIVELVQFLDADGQPMGASSPSDRHAPGGAGFFLLSVVIDLERALERLSELGYTADARHASLAGVAMAVVRDPDGVLVELVDAAGTANLDRLVGA